MLLEKIGVELELNVGDYTQYFNNVRRGILAPFSYPINTDGNRPTMASFEPFVNNMVVQLTDEYYSSQCEWKFFPIVLDQVPDLQKTIKYIIDEGGGQITHSSIPAFVGTHIHLFFKEKKSDLNTFVRGKTILSAFLMEYFYVWIQKSKMSKTLKIMELERLVFNHNILQKLDYKTLGKGLRNNLNQAGFDYYYTNLPKDKYQPVHWSNPNNGKPLTLELRYIPNSFLYTATEKDVQRFLWTVEDKVNYINNLSPEQFAQEHVTNKKQCIFWHKKLLDLYIFLKGNNNMGHLPRYQWSTRVSADPGLSIASYESQYFTMFSTSQDHQKSHRYAIHQIQSSISNYCDRNTFSSVADLEKIIRLGHYTDFKGKVAEYAHKIQTAEDCTFPVHTLDKIVLRQHRTYPDIPLKNITIDSDGDEVSRTYSRTSRPRAEEPTAVLVDSTVYGIATAQAATEMRDSMPSNRFIYNMTTTPQGLYELAALQSLSTEPGNSATATIDFGEIRPF